MKTYKYAIKRAKIQKKAEKAFLRGRTLLINYWNKKLHKLDFKFYNGVNNGIKKN